MRTGMTLSLIHISPSKGYSEQRLAEMYRSVAENLKQVPGVVSASFSLYSPMGGMNWSFGASIEGQPPVKEEHAPSWDRVSAHYFETIGTRILRGRGIEEQDTPKSRPVAVINETFAKRYFRNDEDPIGKRVGMGGPERGKDYEIVGIAEGAKYQDAYGPAYPTTFVALLQNIPYKEASDTSMQTRSNHMNDIELWIQGQPTNLEATIRETLAKADPNLIVLKVESLAEQVSENFNQERLVARLTGLFGLLALVLACVGLYGVTAYGVAQRKGEIGIRMAMGCLLYTSRCV